MMEDKLKNLRSALDETLFRDGEFSEKGKANVRRKIEKHRQTSSLNIFHRLGPWFKPVLSTVACLILFIGAVYFVSHQGGQGSSSLASHSASRSVGAFPYPQFLPKQKGKLTVLYIGKTPDEKTPVMFSRLQKKTISKKQHMSLQQAKKRLGKLHVNQTPYYLVFDSNGVALRTSDWRKMGRFLHEFLVKKTGFPYPQLLSANKGKLRALIIDDVPGGSTVPKFFLQSTQFPHFFTGYTVESLKNAREEYPKLGIPKKNPYFIFFDTDSVVYRTHSEQDAAHFVKERLNNYPVPFPYPKLLSRDYGRFHLLKVGDPEHYLSKWNMEKMDAGTTSLDLKQAQQSYPKLKINKSPYYILFDQQGVAFRGDSVKKMKQFLNQQFPYPTLLSDQEGKYALLVVQKNHNAHYPDFLKNVDLTNENLARLGLSNVHFPTLEQAKKDFPKLNVKSAPAFLFFSTNSLAFQTNSEQKAVQFLEIK